MESIDAWKTQFKKGYLELCLLTLIEQRGRLYGFEMLDLLEDMGLPTKEGTLYPVLSRLSDDEILDAHWDLKMVKGHPRKFYSLSKNGKKILQTMRGEFQRLVDIIHNLEQPLVGEGHATTTRIRSLSQKP